MFPTLHCNSMFNIGVKVALFKEQLMVGTIAVGTRCFGVLNLFCWDKTSYDFVVEFVL